MPKKESDKVLLKIIHEYFGEQSTQFEYLAADIYKMTNKNIIIDEVTRGTIDKEGNIEKFRLLEDGNLIKPLAIETVANLQNYDLLTYLDKVREKQNLSTKNKHIYEVALKEAMKRGLVLDISPHEAND